MQLKIYKTNQSLFKKNNSIYLRNMREDINQYLNRNN